MFENSLENLLRKITLQAIAKLIGSDEGIGNLIFALTWASASRQIVGCVQFEEDWQCKIDESDTWYAHFRVKVAPSLCAIACSNGAALNEASWDFAIPNVNTIEVGAIPTNAIDYLAMGRVIVQTADDGDEDDERDSKDYTFKCLSNVLGVMGR